MSVKPTGIGYTSGAGEGGGRLINFLRAEPKPLEIEIIPLKNCFFLSPPEKRSLFFYRAM